MNSGLRVTASKVIDLYKSGQASEIAAFNDSLRYTSSSATAPGRRPRTRRRVELGLPYLPAVHRGARSPAATCGRSIPAQARCGCSPCVCARSPALRRAGGALHWSRRTRRWTRLLVLLLIGGAGSLIVAAVGGWFLAGKSLAPVNEAFDRQHAFVAARLARAADAAGGDPGERRVPAAGRQPGLGRDRRHRGRDRPALGARRRAAGPRPRRGGDRPQRDLFDLASVVDGAVESMQSLAAERGVVLSRESESGLLVEGDRDQLRQLVLILLDNALRYTPAGGSVAGSVSRAGDWATIRVADTGIGIDQDVVDRIFDRFYRADEARNRDSGGAGLGLAIAKQLVEEHGGRIAVESTPGKGATFTVRLPMVRRKAAAATPV